MNPLEHAHVLAVARPEELAVLLRNQFTWKILGGYLMAFCIASQWARYSPMS